MLILGTKGVPDRILSWSRQYAAKIRAEERSDLEKRGTLYQEMLQGLDLDFSGYGYHTKEEGRGRLRYRKKGFLLDPSEVYDLRHQEMDGFDLVSWLDQDPRGRAGLAVFKNGKLVTQREQERELATCTGRRRMYDVFDCSRCWKPSGGPLIFKALKDNLMAYGETLLILPGSITKARQLISFLD